MIQPPSPGRAVTIPPMPRIVVLDGLTSTPNVPSHIADAAEPTWDELASHGDVKVHDRTAPADLLARAADAPVLITNKTVLSGDTIRALPSLKYIGLLSTGTNVVDLEAAKQAGVTVTNVPGYSGDSVAQHVFALLLELTNRVGAHDHEVRAGRWSGGADFSFTVAPLVELAGKKLGILGMGDIGQRVAAIGHAFNMTILAHSRTRRELAIPIEWVGVDELFGTCDAITLHCPLSEQTKHLVNASRLSKMKRSAYLINTGRGPLVDEPALAEALNSGQIAGAGLDVLSLEPPRADNPLLKAKNCLITPHVAWATREARFRLLHTVAKNLKAYLEGKPQNVVA